MHLVQHSLLLFLWLLSFISLGVTANANTWNSTFNPLCGLVAATNVEVLHPRWSCDVNGQPIVYPCLSPVWNGIACDNETSSGNIISINLTAISGTIAPSLGQISFLQTLSFIYTDLNGTIPSALGCLSSLNSLTIYDGFVTGTLPSTDVYLPLRAWCWTICFYMERFLLN